MQTGYLAGCLTSAKLINLSVPQLPHLENRDNSSSSVVASGCSEFIHTHTHTHTPRLEWWLAHSKDHIRVNNTP